MSLRALCLPCGLEARIFVMRMTLSRKPGFHWNLGLIIYVSFLLIDNTRSVPGQRTERKKINGNFEIGENHSIRVLCYFLKIGS